MQCLEVENNSGNLVDSGKARKLTITINKILYFSQILAWQNMSSQGQSMMYIFFRKGSKLDLGNTDIIVSFRHNNLIV